jgi:hypothetical protein
VPAIGPVLTDCRDCVASRIFPSPAETGKDLTARRPDTWSFGELQPNPGVFHKG